MSEYGQIRFAIQKKLDMYSEDGGSFQSLPLYRLGKWEC